MVTFPTGYLFRTEPGWSILCGGPPNHLKPGIQPLVGLVESDWLPFPFAMNWCFTQPGIVRFEAGEPFCFFTLVEDSKLEETELTFRSLDDNPDLKSQHEAWKKSRMQFNARLFRGDPGASKQAWQRFYFRGEAPGGAEVNPVDHVNRRRLKAPHW